MKNRFGIRQRQASVSIFPLSRQAHRRELLRRVELGFEL